MFGIMSGCDYYNGVVVLQDDQLFSIHRHTNRVLGYSKNVPENILKQKSCWHFGPIADHKYGTKSDSSHDTAIATGAGTVVNPVITYCRRS